MILMGKETYERVVAIDGQRKKHKRARPSNRGSVRANWKLKSTLGSNIVIKSNRRDPNDIFEPLNSLGEGSSCSVSLVRKRASAMGGSSRPSFVKEHKQIPPPSSFSGFFSYILTTYDQESEEVRRTSEEESEDTAEISNRSTSEMIAYGKMESMTYALKSARAGKGRSIQDEIKNEVAILQGLDHPNIVKAYESYCLNNEVSVLLELCNGGDLYARNPYTEHEARRIMKSVTSAVAYMHSKKIIHRDLKFENIVFTSTDVNAAVKIIDFGLSKKVEPGTFLNAAVGTAYSMAPEVLKGKYNSKADIWSLGVIAFMLLSSTVPFHGETRQMMQKIIRAKYAFSSSRWETVSSDAKKFVSTLLVKHSAYRPSATEALLLPWLDDETAVSDERDGNDESHVDVMDRLQASMQTFASYGLLKKLALMLIAQKATHDKVDLQSAMFSKFNESRDGEVTLAEFMKILDHYDYSEEEAKQLFDGIKLDTSEVLYHCEYLAATIESDGYLDELQVAEAFDRLDIDDSGDITVSDLRSVLGKNVPQQCLDDLIMEGDTDEDGRISYDDFLGLWSQEDDERRLEDLRNVKARRARKSEKSLQTYDPCIAESFSSVEIGDVSTSSWSTSSVLDLDSESDNFDRLKKQTRRKTTDQKNIVIQHWTVRRRPLSFMH